MAKDVTLQNLTGEEMFEMGWKKYEWNRTNDVGKLTYYYCNKRRSDLPIRDVCNDHGAGHKKEPCYEGNSKGFGTYNECIGCNAKSIDSMIENKKANVLFFVTWYTGKKKKYSTPERRYFVTGYYRIDEIKKVGRPIRFAIKCYEPFFVRIEEAFEITQENLREWRPKRRNWKIYGDQLKFYLNSDGRQLNQVFNHLNRMENVVEDYIEETERVAAECKRTVKIGECRPRSCR